MGAGAYLLWGVFPLYFPLLAPAGALEVMLHRVVWTVVVCAVVMTLIGSWSGFVTAVRHRRSLALLSLAAVLIATNWLVYTYGVLSEQVVETALGYYINPIVTVLLGVVVLHERLRPAQWVAVGIGLVAVVVLTVDYGRLPWIALTLSASFGLYGLVKNRVGRGVGALHSLSVETAVLAPAALAVMVWLEVTGRGSLVSEGPGHAAWLVSAGVVTAVPLMLFAAAARRVPLSTMGLLQYLTPTLQLLIGVVVLSEPMPAGRLVGFALVWTALVVLTIDMMAGARRSRLERDAVSSESSAAVTSLG
jgi:chloramphenicol-sensitive protein RarD